MDLRLYDTLTREKRTFVPLDPNNVRMYVCGPTVYDFAHIGNARPVIVFDVLFRLLRHLFGAGHVTYVRNITDVDDKINDRAARDFPGLPLNEAIRKVTEGTAAQFQADVAALGSLPPTFEPRATDFVLPRADGKTDMVTLIKQLIARGHAYEAGGEVLFDTQSMFDYGALSRRKLDEQRPGARVAVDAHKRNPLDFVLWKQSTDDEPGWESPWGRGRPGWHIECSAMSAAYLGKVFDIHAGGLDLIFPHHENEIAQSRCAHGTPFMANIWMHNAFVDVEGRKMSKSLGNFRTISELREDWQGEVIRYQMLMTHYRQPLDWTESASREAQFIIDRWYEFLRDFNEPEPGEVDAQVVKALSEDLNTHEALARLSVLFDQRRRNAAAARSFVATARFLGFLTQQPSDYFSFYEEAGGLVPKSSPLILSELKKQRDRARVEKDFEKSDYLRNLIYLHGYRVIDGSGDESELIPAEKDFFSVSTATRAKLSIVSRIAIAQAALSRVSGPSFEMGFMSKFGQVFNYTPAFNRALGEAYSALEQELGSGAITEEDLRSAMVDVVLSNLAEPAKFGPDVVAGATLFKLFSGVVQTYDVFFDNNIIEAPEGVEWRIGNVAVSDSSVLAEALPPAIESKFKGALSSGEMAKSNFLVRIESSSAAIRSRSLTLIRAFVTANRFLMYGFGERNELFMPRIGGLEQGIERSVTAVMRLAKSTDGTYILPGSKLLSPYRLSERFIEYARTQPLYDRLCRILSLDLFRPITRELLALDRLCRARNSDDPFARLLWNIEAVETFCGTDDHPERNLRDVLETKLVNADLRPKELKALLKQSERFIRLRRRPGFVSDSVSAAAQHFAEGIIMLLLDDSARGRSRDDEA
jgi:cysteinyl-tRNA synthetase